MELHLMRPEWLWSLVPAGLLALLLWRSRNRKGNWSSVIAPELLPHLVGRSIGSSGPNLLPLLFLGWILAALGASGPSWEKIPQPVHQKQDALVLVLDLSYSMKSSDLAPSRIDRARQKLLDLLKQRREGQTAVIAYAGDAHIVTPLTDDTPTIANLLPALNPDMMPLPGSDPAAAVALAVDLLHSAGIRNGRVLLVTDGIDKRDSKGIKKALKGSGATFAIMGVGTSTGAPIPMPRGGFLKDKSGTIVMPALDDSPLQALAGATGGRYQRLQINGSDLEYLLSGSLLTAGEDTIAVERTADTWHDQGYLLVLLLLPLALGLFRRGWLMCLLPLLLVAQPRPANALGWDDLWLTPDQQGQRALREGDQEAAAQLFDNPQWAGTAAYGSGDYESAIESFSSGEDPNSWYNRGNALARAGQLEEAIAAYQKSLEMLPDQADARENLELLEQLKQQQEQQNQQQNQDQDQEQDQDQNQQQQQNQDQQQQDQDQQQQQNQDQQQQDQDQDQQQQQNQDQQQDQDQQQNQDQQQQDQQEQEQQEQQAQQAEAASEADPEEQERDQAMEQWLRRVPDDPSGLLREKFRYESQMRQQQGARRDDESYW
jgi:Ca-activated chloride channel homolog